VPRASAMAPAVEQMFRHVVAFCKELPGADA
jgi:hypothetical protein